MTMTEDTFDIAHNVLRHFRQGYSLWQQVSGNFSMTDDTVINDILDKAPAHGLITQYFCHLTVSLYLMTLTIDDPIDDTESYKTPDLHDTFVDDIPIAIVNNTLHINSFPIVQDRVKLVAGILYVLHYLEHYIIDCIVIPFCLTCSDHSMLIRKGNIERWTWLLILCSQNLA